MSKGGFNTVAYEADNGAFLPIKVQPETLSLTLNSVANTAPVNAPNDTYGSVRVGGGNRQLGIKARWVSFRFDTAPTGYKQDQIIRLPVLQKATYTSFSKGQTGTYNVDGTGVAVTCVGKGAEVQN